MAVSLNGDGTITGLSTLDSVTITGLTSLTTTDLTADTTTLVVDSANNLVGVGTNSPNDITGTGLRQLVVGNNSGNNGVIVNSSSPGDSAYSFAVNNVKLARVGYDYLNNMTFQTNNAERMRIDSSGNVGIGTSSPNSKTEIVNTNAGGEAELLQIRNNATDASTTSVLRFINSTDSSSYTNGGFIKLIRNASDNNNLTFGTVNAERMRITSTGNVGIGTSSPSQLLEVGSEATSNNYIQVSAANNTQSGIKFRSDSSKTTGWDIGYEGNGNYLFFKNDVTGSVTERMRIDSSGNVGIGTSSPTYKLQVQDGLYTLLAGADSSASTLTDATQKVMRFGVPHYTNAEEPVNVIFASITPGENGVFMGGGTGVFNAATRISFYTAANTTTTNGTERMRIDSSGNVGIGTSTISRGQLQIASAGNVELHLTGSGQTGSGDGMTITANSTEGNIWLRENGYFRIATNNTERMRILSGGNVCIGTTSAVANAQLNVVRGGSNLRIANFENTRNLNGDECLRSLLGTNCNNTTSYHYIASTGGTDRFFVLGNGDVQNTNNSYGAISDVKLKENIVNATPKLDDLMQVKVRNYNLIGDDKKQLGVVAQELEQVFPSMIEEIPDRDEEGNILDTATKSVKYSVFVPMLIKAIQEQQDIIKALETRIQALENQ